MMTEENRRAIVCSRGREYITLHGNEIKFLESDVK